MVACQGRLGRRISVQVTDKTMMFPSMSKMNPVLAQSLGWDIESASDHSVVTLVRRKVILEEVVISKEEFDKINDEMNTDHGILWSELEWKDAEWIDYTADNTEYTAFPGDVTSFSDDCVNFFDNMWYDSFDRIELNEH